MHTVNINEYGNPGKEYVLSEFSFMAIAYLIINCSGMLIRKLGESYS